MFGNFHVFSVVEAGIILSFELTQTCALIFYCIITTYYSLLYRYIFPLQQRRSTNISRPN